MSSKVVNSVNTAYLVLKKWDYKIILSFMAVYEIQRMKYMNLWALSMWCVVSAAPIVLLFGIYVSGELVPLLIVSAVLVEAFYWLRKKIHRLPDTCLPDGSLPKFKAALLALSIVVIGWGMLMLFFITGFYKNFGRH